MGGSAREPFPPIVRWGLLGPFCVFAAAYVLALLGGGENFPKGVLIIATGAAALVEVLAVPTALFLLVRDGRYVSLANIAMTLAAAIPLVLVVFVVLVLNFGHFHI